MNYITIPNTNLSVSPICLGTGSLGGDIDRETSFRLLDRYLDLGGNFLDSAKVYADWLPGERSSSEKTLGRWFQARKNRDRVIVATKGAHPELDAMHIPRLSPAEIRSDLDQSLINLQTEVIDLYWLHRDDPSRPVAEIIETLNAQVQAGKIHYFGCSNWRVDRIREAQNYAVEHDLAGFAGDQMKWSLARVKPSALGDPTMAAMDEALWQYHQETNLAAIPYSSQAGGYFQKLARDEVARLSQKVHPLSANQARFARVQHLAEESGLSITQIGLGYLLSQPFPTIPIVGCKSETHLHDSMSAAEVRLSAEQMAYLGTDMSESRFIVVE